MTNAAGRCTCCASNPMQLLWHNMIAALVCKQPENRIAWGPWRLHICGLTVRHAFGAPDTSHCPGLAVGMALEAYGAGGRAWDSPSVPPAAASACRCWRRLNPHSHHVLGNPLSVFSLLPAVAGSTHAQTILHLLFSQTGRVPRASSPPPEWCSSVGRRWG